MIELMVLRHAKSDWEANSGSDHERPLAKRGHESALRIGRLLADTDRVPKLVLSSTAVRARSTAQHILDVAKDADYSVPPLRTDPGLYDASVTDWLRIVGAVLEQEQLTVEAPRVLVAGHEPTCSAVVRNLTGARCRFPTGGLATILITDLEGGLGAHSRAELESFMIPRMLA